MKQIYHFYLIALLISVFNLTNAQNREYVPMLNEGAKWIETNYYSPNPYGYNQAFELFLEGDTVVNNTLYTKLYKGMISVFCMENYIWGPEYFCALREDTEEQTVWIIEVDENEESLYFDFSLDIGDTVPEDSHFINEYAPVVVYDIDTITGFDGVDRRIWTFEFEGETYGSQMIEGIGNKNGLLSSYFIPFEYFENLFCFTIGTTQVYPYPEPSDCILLSDTCLTVGIQEPNIINQNNQALSVYPVPASEYVYLQIETEIQKEEVLFQIIDFTGKLVYSAMIVSNQNSVETIKVSAWPAGIYIAILNDNGRMMGKCNFVVE